MKLFKSKHIIFYFITCLLLSVSAAWSQEDKSKSDSFEVDTVSLEQAFKDSTFVLEANSIRGRYSYNNFVSPTTNFVKVNGENIVIQTASDFGIGYNGLGGITIEGNIRSYELKERNGGYTLVMQINSSIIGFSNVTVRSNASGNASAELRTGYGEYINFSGTLYPTAYSRNYQGNTIF